MQVLWSSALQFSIVKEVVERAKSEGLSIPQMAEKCAQSDCGMDSITEKFFYNLLSGTNRSIIFGTIWKSVCKAMGWNYEDLILTAVRNYLEATKDTWVYIRKEDRDRGAYVEKTKHEIQKMKDQKILDKAKQIQKRIDKELKRAEKAREKEAKLRAKNPDEFQSTV